MNRTSTILATALDKSSQDDTSLPSVHLFPSELGWMAIAWQDTRLVRLSFGHPSAIAASQAIEGETVDEQSPQGWVQSLVAQLQDFAAGTRVDFHKAPIDQSGFTPFQRRVTSACREIAWGETCSYGQLAERAGSPRAARAVGNVMANNPYPLIVPCHRVLAAQSLGGYSASSGLAMKRRLLQREQLPRRAK